MLVMSLHPALWRLKLAEFHLQPVDRSTVSLCHEVVVDLYVVTSWTGRVLRGAATRADLTLPSLAVDDVELLSGIPRNGLFSRVSGSVSGGCTQWRWRHRLSQLGRHAEAVETAMSTATVEPLPESDNRALIHAHLAEGNRV
jgi:hypothetical protein